jgi:isopropylmalate/homocitrate/citramalate synthase
MHKNNSNFVHLYDTTLRDDAQRKGLCFSLEDKVKITRLLDGLELFLLRYGSLNVVQALAPNLAEGVA